MRCECVKWIKVAWYKIKFQAFVNAVIKFLIPWTHKIYWRAEQLSTSKGRLAPQTYNLYDLQFIYPMALQPKSGLGLPIFCLHNVISLAASFQLRQSKNLAASYCITSSDLVLGSPTDLTPPNLTLSTFLRFSVPSILWTCPTYWSLFSFKNVTRSGSPYSSYNSYDSQSVKPNYVDI
jgi:hypothetical protein